jgi:hypothetical protein
MIGLGAKAATEEAMSKRIKEVFIIDVKIELVSKSVR